MTLITTPAPDYLDLLGMHQDLEMETYHKKTKGVSSSVIKECLKSEKSYRDYINGNKKKSKKMDTGTILHDYILSPAHFKKKYAYIKDDPKSNKKENKEYMEDWQANNPDRHLLTEEQYTLCKQVKKEFFSHQILTDIYDRSLKEASCFIDSHLDEDDPKDFIIRKKCRPDLHIPSEGMVFDIKISESVDEDIFRKIIELFDYDLSAAWYLDILSEHYQTEFKYFGFIVIEPSFPHSMDIFILDEDSINVGRDRYIRGEKRYKEFLMKNNDPGKKRVPEFKFISTSKWRK